MPLLTLVIAATLSTVPTEKHVDAGWGVLARSSHLHGAWRIQLADRAPITGDWIVINREDYVTRDMGGGSGPAKAIHFVDSKSARHCSLDADHPSYVYCVDRIAGFVQLAQGATLSLPKGTTELDWHHQLNGGYVRAGQLVIDVKPKAPSRAQLEMLFERTVGKSLASWLGATVARDRDVLVLTVPIRQEHHLSVGTTSAHNTTYAQEVVIGFATIRIGTRPEALDVTARETSRFVEDCIAPGGTHGSGCMPRRPLCTRRT